LPLILLKNYGKNIDRLQLELAQELFEERPAKTELPKYLSQIGQVKVDYQLDFGGSALYPKGSLHRRAETPRL
jgi:hypothetical protein